MNGPTDTIDAQCRDLVKRAMALRAEAGDMRLQADHLDEEADALYDELGDWNRVREAALRGSREDMPGPYVLAGAAS